MKVAYFAWVRERIGKSEEEIEPPAQVRTIADLVAWLSGRGRSYATPRSPKAIRAAIDRTHVKSDARLEGAREVAPSGR